MQIDSVKKYLTSTSPYIRKLPYFLFVGDEQYKTVKDELSFMGLKFIPTSGFCSSDDKMPDIGGLFTEIAAADVNASGEKFVVTGLGEFLALLGDDEATSTLSSLKDINIGNAKVVLLLRGLTSQIAELKKDPRFDNYRYSVVDNAVCNLSFTLADPSIGLSAISGFKAMLAMLENGHRDKIVVNTNVNFDNPLLTVRKVSNAYEGIIFSMRGGFILSRDCGSDEQWAKLLTELNQNNGSFDKVFELHKLGSIGDNLMSDFYARITLGDDYLNWLYFICLKCKIGTLSNGYLRFVLENTSKFEDFSGNILNAIIDISHTDKRFAAFYKERKALVEKFQELDIADFVRNNRKIVAESIYKLTDNTKTEREDIVAWLSEYGMIPFTQLDGIYPALAAYLKKYVFKCPDPELADLLTGYFEAYKRQKLSNKLEPEFLDEVEELARSRKFNQLPTRNVIIDSMDKSDTFLYWLDALGVEFLSFIETLVQKRGLSISITIARAKLPTITFLNRDFYDNWQGRKDETSDLDNIKHKKAGGYNFSDNELPIHLAKELDIITKVIDEAAIELTRRHCKRFLIVSDHGASRLAVLRRKEEKYETGTSKGEHSGRCCKLFQPHDDLPFAAEENGYLVLADYGRFKGSRAADVEVHGGASLEEVVVPIIELSLKDRNVTVELVKETVAVDFRSGTTIELFFNTPVQNVYVVWNGKSYPAAQTDGNHYSVLLSDMKRAGEYFADVYAEENRNNPIGQITIKAQGKSAKVNNAFDDLF